MDSISLGLQISAFGLVITFLSLGLLILVISLLRAVFPAPNKGEPSPVPMALPEEKADEDQSERLAALTAAWWYWHKKRSSSLGKQLEQGPGKRWRKKDKA